MRTFGVLLATGLLAGCQSYGGMSADQITAAVKDKNASATCITAVGTAGVVKIVSINADKGMLPNGTVSVNAETCAVTVSNAIAPAARAVSPVTISRGADGGCYKALQDPSGRTYSTERVDISRCQ